MNKSRPRAEAQAGQVRGVISLVVLGPGTKGRTGQFEHRKWDDFLPSLPPSLSLTLPSLFPPVQDKGEILTGEEDVRGDRSLPAVTVNEKKERRKKREGKEENGRRRKDREKEMEQKEVGWGRGRREGGGGGGEDDLEVGEIPGNVALRCKAFLKKNEMGEVDTPCRSMKKTKNHMEEGRRLEVLWGERIWDWGTSGAL